MIMSGFDPFTTFKLNSMVCFSSHPPGVPRNPPQGDVIAMTSASVVVGSFSWLRHCSEENGEFLMSILSISDQTKGGYSRTLKIL